MSGKNNKNNGPLILGISFILVSVLTLIGFVILIFSGSSGATPNQNTNQSEFAGTQLKIISGSENQSLEPFIEQFNEKTGAKVEIEYLGSVDILLKLNQNDTAEVDAVWPASTIVLNLTENQSLKHSESIFRSPVILGIKSDKAKELGWDSKNDITVDDLLTTLSNRDMKIAMTNATQSNSGLSGYLAFLQAFAETDNTLTSADIEKTEVQEKTRALLNLVNRSSGSSGWLKDLFVEKYETLDAMINYEALIIETNQELETKGKQPLQAMYLSDGMVVADSPLAYLDKSDEKKEQTFLELQKFLLSDEVKKDLIAKGRRAGLGLRVDINENNTDSVFRPEWGLLSEIPYTTLTYPKKEVIDEALNLYQVSLRKPSFTVYVLDVSGSMQGTGLSSLKEAMQTIVDQDSAKKYFLQASPRDVSIVIPFNSDIVGTKRFVGSSDESIKDFRLTIDSLEAGGGTDMYSPLLKAFEIINSEEDITQYFPSVILMTDGRSDNEEALNNLLNNQDIPVFPIMFGDAQEEQLNQIVEITTGRVFDGRKNLINAFRQAKGYN